MRDSRDCQRSVIILQNRCPAYILSGSTVRLGVRVANRSLRPGKDVDVSLFTSEEDPVPIELNPYPLFVLSRGARMVFFVRQECTALNHHNRHVSNSSAGWVRCQRATMRTVQP